MTIKIVTNEKPRVRSGYVVVGDGDVVVEGNTPVKELTSVYDLFDSESWEKKDVEDYTRRRDNVPQFVEYEEFMSEQPVSRSGTFTSYRAVWWEVTLDGD